MTDWGAVILYVAFVGGMFAAGWALSKIGNERMREEWPSKKRFGKS